MAKTTPPLALALAATVMTGAGVITSSIQKSSVAPVAPASAKAAGSACPVSSLNACPVIGCETDGTGHAALNKRKRTIPDEPSPVVLSFADFKMLQGEAGAIFPPKRDLQIPAEDREKLSDLKFSKGMVSEGDLVQISAFIVAEPHPNAGESVNCGLKGPANNDFHIPVGEQAPPAGTDFQGIVVEMIPQERNAGWTVAKLQDIMDKGLRIRVIGQLLYDSIHVPNSDPNNVMGGQPKRMSLWELHPITEFAVCTKAACSDTRTSDWTQLEAYTVGK